ncbi:hypothetical protein SELMODRAFT_77558 [Selaginella moellendorffii]|uniref:non-specific serine/threonine protein kinase n=1 Tax=Selaginella moellendorffii TaxID=88036 RepID=D8QT55_SELML|nr:leucine-rich repeat receptor-like serine/threonine-protein kinase BAM1 [Selaginella moellendorffii]EFJ37553.1 hypothetical protein SELMODRAFT_77558 [Selaginella moellendorffii]|eukprot:XP_002962293.1 leucine-rich repeat receptor-like serine/threonine-protein kinase BAM1 [Selaginella moellendorffii]
MTPITPLFLAILVFFTAAAEGLTPDGQSLLAFKASIEDPATHLRDWNESDATPCRWTGITCDSQNRVSSLTLSNMSLSGSIAPGTLSRLSALANLSLDVNDLGGALPAELLGALPLLRYLNISHCNFSGDFPANLSSASPSLAILDAYNNNFTGALPIGLSALPLLAHVHLGGSLFSGSIPREYGSIKSLQYLALSGNDLSGEIPAEMGDLESLEQLYLGYYNHFSGGIPRSFGRLKSLRRLDLASAGINGSIPIELGGLRRLDTLFLQLNSLAGSIPDAIGGLRALQSLDLSCNQLTGGIPASLEKLQELKLLNLFRNNLSGEIPSFVGDMPNLEVLFLWGNGFVGAIPEFLGGNGQLWMLDLSKNALNGSVPSSLCRGGKLATLILQQNRLSGSIPEELGSCASLEKVRLGDNLLSGAIPRGLFALPNLDMVELMRNKLDGVMGDEEFAAPKLEKIDLSENLLRGEISEGIGALSMLKELQISYNRLAGAVPAGLGRMQWLLQLNLTHNFFSGGIPPEVGSCRSLTMLDLSVNQLSGEIPRSLEALEVLGVLNLSRNAFSGGIPRGIALLQSLNSVDFSYNRLSGAIPATDQAFNRSSYVGNLGLCGAPLGPCPKNPNSRGYGGHGRGRSDPELLAWLVGALFSAALLVLVVGVCCFFRKYRRYLCRLGFLRPRSRGAGAWKLTAFQKLGGFSVAHILECLSNEDNIIGRGGSGIVYKGVMPSGEIVAVKKLSGFNPAAAAGVARGKIGGSMSHSDHGFSAEVQTLGKIRHRNIVKLLGFCSNKETNVLVYEYMPNGSLGEALHGSSKGAVMLDWATRYKIALQAANGLCYLHHDCSPLIVHRDVKSNNILLDAEFQARVADFGLAKLFQDSGKSESMSSIAGSYGYIAPEYAYTLKVNEKSDIYSFGVVLLELVSGRRPIEPEFGDGVDIVQWVRKKIQTKDGVLEVLDSRIREENLPLQEIMLVLRVALLCTSDLPVDRPTMRDVVQMLGDARPGKNKEESSTDFGDLSSSQSQLLSPV